MMFLIIVLFGLAFFFLISFLLNTLFDKSEEKRPPADSKRMKPQNKNLYRQNKIKIPKIIISSGCQSRSKGFSEVD